MSLAFLVPEYTHSGRRRRRRRRRNRRNRRREKDEKDETNQRWKEMRTA
jgi:hypothetical protein